MQVDGRLVRHSAPYRYVWPSELDLMARLGASSYETDGRAGCETRSPPAASTRSSPTRDPGEAPAPVPRRRLSVTGESGPIPVTERRAAAGWGASPERRPQGVIYRCGECHLTSAGAQQGGRAVSSPNERIAGTTEREPLRHHHERRGQGVPDPAPARRQGRQDKTVSDYRKLYHLSHGAGEGLGQVPM